MPDYVRRMRPDDIAYVAEIDREAFPTEWPPINFKRELDNRLARYIVACRADEVDIILVEAPPETGVSQLVRRIFGRDATPEKELRARGPEQISGFAGMWVMADEAHLTSIATRECYRRQGIGELLLQSVVELAMQDKAQSLTLEVRISNTEAQSLYIKYGFSQVGMRRGYYTDNREDALLMSTDHLTSTAFQEHITQLKKAYAERWGEERYQLSR
jgi:ribosomal-protein-alanine N-acetyltransferase